MKKIREYAALAAVLVVIGLMAAAGTAIFHLWLIALL